MRLLVAVIAGALLFTGCSGEQQAAAPTTTAPPPNAAACPTFAEANNDLVSFLGRRHGEDDDQRPMGKGAEGRSHKH